MTIDLFGLTFHVYGMLIGIAIVVAFFLVERKAIQQKLNLSQFYWIAAVGVVGGLVGARAWHVITDFHLYQNNLAAVFNSWEGGLGIVGGVLGGMIAVGLLLFVQTKLSHRDLAVAVKQAKVLGDLVTFGLPFGQAIGRVGNWVNQELYGFPTALPWGIPIDPAYRENGWESFERFHPLFLYEAIPMVILGLIIWRLSSRSNFGKFWRIGSGHYLLLYAIGYCAVRFSLEFLRLQKKLVGNTPFTATQLFVGLLLFPLSWIMVQEIRNSRHVS